MGLGGIFSLGLIGAAALHGVCFANDCYRVLRPLERAQAVTTSDIAQASCAAEETPRALIYRPTIGTYAAPDALAANDVVAVGDARLLADIAPGQTVRTASVVGPVRVERAGVALQAGRAGDKVFVAYADGSVAVAEVVR